MKGQTYNKCIPFILRSTVYVTNLHTSSECSAEFWMTEYNKKYGKYNKKLEGIDQCVSRK